MLSIIAAVAANGVIGKDGEIPFYLPKDLERFKCITRSSPVVMGHRTFNHFGGALPDRINIVMTKDRDFAAKGVLVAHSLAEMNEFIALLKADEVFIIGGAKLYHDTIARAERIYLSSMVQEYDGDAMFPKINQDEWDVLFVRYFDDHSFTILERKSTAHKIVLDAKECSSDEVGPGFGVIPKSLRFDPKNAEIMDAYDKYVPHGRR